MFFLLCFIVLYSGSCVTLHRIQKITSPSNCLFAASQKLCRDIFCKDAAKKTPLFAQRVNIFGSDKAGNSLIINTSPFMRFLPQHAMPEAIELLKSCKTMAPSSKANNAKKLLLLEISYFLRTENTTKPYILKAKKFAEPPFQSKKNCGKSA